MNNNKIALGIWSIITLTFVFMPTVHAKDKTCTNILRFEKSRSFGQDVALNKFLNKKNVVKSTDTLNELIDQSLKCAEKRKKSLSNRKAFGAFLGAVAGAALSNGDEVNGATGGATVGYAIFDDTSDKKLKSYKRVIDYLTQQVNIIKTERKKRQLEILHREQMVRVAKEKKEREQKEKVLEQKRRLTLKAALKKKRLKYNKVKNNLRNLNAFLESKSCTYTNDWKVKKHLKDAVCNEAVKTYEKLFESKKKHIIAVSVVKNKAAISKLGLKKEILEAGFFGIKFREALAIFMDSPKNKVFIEKAIFFGDFILVIKQKHMPAMKWGFENDYGDLKYTSTNITADGIKDLMVNYDGSGYLGRIFLEGQIDLAIKSIMGIK